MAITPEIKLIKRLMAELELTPTALGEKAGYGKGSAAYSRVHPYLKGSRPMGKKVRADLARALDIPAEALLDPDGTAARLARAETIYASFLVTEDGHGSTEDERAAIRRVLPILHNPSVDVLKAVLFALRGQGPALSAQDVELNAMLDQANEKPRHPKR